MKRARDWKYARDTELAWSSERVSKIESDNRRTGKGSEFNDGWWREGAKLFRKHLNV